PARFLADRSQLRRHGCDRRRRPRARPDRAADLSRRLRAEKRAGVARSASTAGAASDAGARKSRRWLAHTAQSDPARHLRSRREMDRGAPAGAIVQMFRDALAAERRRYRAAAKLHLLQTYRTRRPFPPVRRAREE